MKKHKNIILTSLLSILIICSCASKKATVKAVGDKEITIPCSDFRTDKDYFRSSGIGTSKDLSNSVKQAEVKTKASLAGVIETKIREVSKIYTIDRKIDEESEFSEKFQNDTRAAVNNALRDLSTICKKTTQKPDGTYNTFIAYECSKDVIYNGIKKTLSNDQKLRQDYDEMKFKEVFDQEMEKLEKEQP